MTRLRKMMLEELERRNYSQSTPRTYIRTVEDFARYFGRRPDQLGPAHIRQYQAQLFSKRKLAPNTVTQRLAALRFFFVKTLHKPWETATCRVFASARGNRWHTGKEPIDTKVPWQACQQTAQRAGITKRVHPHTLRHCFATPLLEAGANLRTIQVLLGHRDLEETTIYLHLSQRHLNATASPLDSLALSLAPQQDHPVPNK
jgi:site-specific recombinase XerD